MERKLDELCPYIRDAGMQRRDSWKSFARRIYDHQFFYCFKGTANICIEDRMYRVRPGYLVIIPPNTPHRFWVEEDEEGELYWFHCDFFYYPDRQWITDFYKGAPYVRLFGSRLPEPEHIRENPVFEGGYTLPEMLVFEGSSEMEHQFYLIQREYNKQTPHWELTTKQHFFEIFMMILDKTNASRSKMSAHSHVVHQIRQAVEHNYYRKLSVAEICAETGLNTEYASKVFKQETGSRLVEYVNRYRLRKAKALLLETDLSVADISEMVGFSSENYFCSVMKKYEGKTADVLRGELLCQMQEESDFSESSDPI